MFHPRTWRATRATSKRGYHVHKAGKRVTQLGATFVIAPGVLGPGPTVEYEHLDADSTDHAPIDSVIEVLRARDDDLMAVRVVIFDFYGTLAEATERGLSWAELFEEMGHTLSPEATHRFWNEGNDGRVHDDHSLSRDHYVAWQHTRLRDIIRESGVPEGDDDLVFSRMAEGLGKQDMTAYPDVVGALEELAQPWAQPRGLFELGLGPRPRDRQRRARRWFDVVVSSAWVGARKPHPRIYARTLEQLGLEPSLEALFVGDTWTCDVDGPLPGGHADPSTSAARTSATTRPGPTSSHGRPTSRRYCASQIAKTIGHRGHHLQHERRRLVDEEQEEASVDDGQLAVGVAVAVAYAASGRRSTSRRRPHRRRASRSTGRPAGAPLPRSARRTCARRGRLPRRSRCPPVPSWSARRS